MTKVVWLINYSYWSQLVLFFPFSVYRDVAAAAASSESRSQGAIGSNHGCPYGQYSVGCVIIIQLSITFMYKGFIIYFDWLMKRRKRARRTAKQLIEQTIQRNQSPVPPSPPCCVGVDNATVESSSLSSRASEESTTKTVAEHDVPGGRSSGREVVADDFNAGVGGDEVSLLLGDYQHTVTVGRNNIKISGSNLQLVEVSR